MCVESEYTKCYDSDSPLTNNVYYGFWTSGQREDPCCCSGPWLWKLDALTNRSFSTDPWVSSAWFYEWSEPNCGSTLPPPNDQETCLNILNPAAPSGSGGRWNDIICNSPMCPLCEIEV